MKTNRSKLVVISLISILALIFAQGCFLTEMISNVVEGAKDTGIQVSEGVDPDLYNKVNAQYMKTVGGFATCYSELSIEMARQDKQFNLFESFMDSNVELTQAYREPLAGLEQNQERARAANNDPDTNGDLQKLLNEGATPAQMGVTLALSANVFTEAQMVLPDSQVAQNAQWSIDESFSNMKVIIRDCNDLATEYNTLMAPISAQTMQAIAEALGKGVPPSLPLLSLSYNPETELLNPGLAYPGKKPVQDPFYIPGLNE